MPPIAFLSVVLIIIIIVVVRLFLQYREELYNDSQPITSHHMRVVSKRKDSKFKRSGTTSYYVPEKDRKHYIKFEFESTKKIKEIKEFIVLESDYDKFNEGNSCVVNLQGTRYISLEQQEESDPI